MPEMPRPKPPISEDERLTGQVFWFVMLIGWTPLLAAYGHVLDPVTSAQNGIIATFVDDITLYQQTGWGLEAFGILTVAGGLSALSLLWLGWRALWPVPVFLLWSCLIYIFNAPGLGDTAEMAVHGVYAVLAFVSTYLFLRHGHLLAPAFIGYVALLMGDAALHHTALPGGLLGRVFEGYVPGFGAALRFLAVAILARMIWLLVRDNRAFFRELDRGVMRRSAARTLRFWWPMPVIFLAFGVFWWTAANVWVAPRVMAELDRDMARIEAELAPLLNIEVDGAAAVREGIERDVAGAQGLAELVRIVESLPDLQKAGDWLNTEVAAFRTESQAFYTAWQAGAESADDPLEVKLRAWMQLQVGASNIRIQLAIIDAGFEAMTKGDFPAIARRKINEVFPRSALPQMQVRSCWFWQIGCLVDRAIAIRVNRSMDNLHNSMVTGIVDQVGAIDEAVDGNVVLATQGARALSQTRHEEFSLTATRAITNGFQTWRNVSFLALVYSLIVLLKSGFIVFSRVIFSPKGGAVTAQFLPHEPPAETPAITAKGAVHRIPASAAEAFFVSRWGVTLEGPPPARRRPLGLRFPVARILSGTWAMNRIDGQRHTDEDEFDADLRVDEPTELVVWTLGETERVVFRFSDFVGMSEGVHVRRISSLSITTLVLGRMIYHAADGPGTLILRTTAAARLSTQEDGQRPAPMPKLVAWGAETRFGVLAALTTADTFLSGYNLKVAQGDRVVWDSSTKRGDGPGTGILRFVKSFLLPI